jgi:2-polyprenyl-3-methyl-5-hydroxy-6-metoxy-1,4-benzoquinol methylase
LSGDYPEIEFIQDDVLTFGREPYDIVLCSLALHHFAEDKAVALLRHCRELSKKYVLVSDLRRGWLATVGVYLLTTFLFREPMTRTDARLSAERAFSFAEFRSLAVRAGWRDFGHAKFAWARQALWLEPDGLV